MSTPTHMLNGILPVAVTETRVVYRNGATVRDSFCADGVGWVQSCFLTRIT
jgi:hypothetical protein